MKWIGQHIYDLVARFRNDVYITGTLDVTSLGTFDASVTVAGKISLKDAGDSIFVGYEAGLNDDASANLNVGVGYQALRANTTGSNNTASGYQSLRLNTTGGTNTAAGRDSLYSNTTGSSNTALGYAALLANTTGSYSVAVGREALYNNTASNQTAVGFQTLYYNTIGGNNTAHGYRALYNTTTVVVALGTITGGSGYTDGTYTSVLMTHVSGSTALTYPTATIVVAGGVVTTVTLTSFGIGFKDTTTVLSAAAANIGGTGSGFTVPVATISSGDLNTAIGVQALYSNKQGDGNTATGTQAMYSNTTASNNTAIGYQALYSNTTGANNIAHGYRALYSNTTASSNTATGFEALYSNTTGTNNTAYGFRALRQSSTASNNTAIGRDALYSNTTGANNTAHGYRALYSNTTGGSNTAIGREAGRFIADGTTDNTSTSNSVFLGYNTKALAISQTNQIVIGDTAVGLGSNTAILGNSSITKTQLQGNVGIGTAAPVNKLEIQNTTSVAGGISKGEYPLQLTNTGTGNTGVTGIAFSSQSDDTDIKSAIVFKGSTNGYNRGDIQFLMNSANDNTNVAVDTSAVLTIKDSGNVGIGTASPQTALQVGDTTGDNFITLSGGATGAEYGINWSFNNPTTSKYSSIKMNYNDRSTKGLEFNTNSAYRFSFNTQDSAGVYGGNLMTIKGDGNVGIGTTNPGSKLQVYTGNTANANNGITLMRGAGLSVFGIKHRSDAVGTYRGAITWDAAEVMTFLSNGNVGIGMTAPKNKLDIAGSLGRGAPVTKTTDFTVAATENWLIMNGTATITITLPTASSFTGRELMIKNIAAYTVISDSSNVKPIDTNTAATAILPATAGSWCTLVSDGTNWVTMMN
jgi:hypothetical protein